MHADFKDDQLTNDQPTIIEETITGEDIVNRGRNGTRATYIVYISRKCQFTKIKCSSMNNLSFIYWHFCVFVVFKSPCTAYLGETKVKIR